MLIAGTSDLLWRRLPGKHGNIIPAILIMVGLAQLAFCWQAIGLMTLLNVAFIIAILTLYPYMGVAGGDVKMLICLIIALPLWPIGLISIGISVVPGLLLIISKIRPIPYVLCLAIGYITFICMFLFY
jgi:hypothetical protein